MNKLSCGVRYLLGGFYDLPRTIWTVFFMQTIMRGGDFVIPFLTLFLTRKLGFNEVQAGVWVTANLVTGLIGTSIAGKFGDRYGRKSILSICMIATAILFLICGFLPQNTMIPKILMIASFFQGSIRPVVGALIMDLSPVDRRKESFSLNYLGINLGVAMGTMAAGFFFEKHQQWIFFGSVIALLFAFIIMVRNIPSTIKTQSSDNIQERPVEGNAFQAFLARPSLMGFCLVSLLFSFAYCQSGFGLTLYTNNIFGSNGAKVFGSMMSLNAVAVLATTPIIGRLTSQMTSSKSMAISTVFISVGFGMLYFKLNLVLLSISTFIWTLGEVIWATNCGAYLADRTPSNFRGRFQSFFEVSNAIGLISSPILCGMIAVNKGIHFSWACISFISLICTAGIVWLSIWEKQKTVIDELMNEASSSL